jgi:osmotically-inducible protein OsmY
MRHSTTTETLRVFVRVTLVTACVLAVPRVARGQMPDARPLDPAQNPPSLSERAKGAEASIPVAVQRSIDGDAELAPYDIKVAANERRNITLSGTVPSAELRDRAEVLARKASGTQHVHNDIIVTSRPSDRRGDDAATTDESDPARVMPQRE